MRPAFRTGVSLSFGILSVTASVLAILLASCGKKGAPTLASYEKPPAPRLQPAIHREGAIILRWSYPKHREPEIVEFMLLRSVGASPFEKLTHIVREDRLYEDRASAEGLLHRYVIVSQNHHGVYSDDSNTVEVTPSRVPPAAVNLQYEVTDRNVILRWDHPVQDVRFNVYRSAEKGRTGLEPLNATPITGRQFVDRFQQNTVVYYAVRGLTDSLARDEGPLSEEIAFDPLDLVPSAPAGLRVHATADAVFLSWSEAPESWVTGFRVYRRTSKNEFTLVGETQVPSFIDRAAPVLSQDYRVTAVGPLREGPGAEAHGVQYVPIEEDRTSIDRAR